MPTSQKSSPEMQAAGPPHIIVEAVERAGNTNDYLVKPIAASQAFRKYNWLFGTPVLNSAGNLRGMVVNKGMRVIYGVSSTVGEYLSLAGILIELGKESSKMRQIAGSSMSVDQKGPLLLSMGSMAILRAVTSPVPAAAHLLAQSIEGYCYLAFVATGSQAPLGWVDKLKAGDAVVSSAHSRVFDGQNYYNFISHHLIVQ